MADEWFVRVHDKEYGPVDLDTLREWQREGHLIAENDLREAGRISGSRRASSRSSLKPLPPPQRASRS
jgi:hypothetical protein